jgi:hypothetical protein
MPNQKRRWPSMRRQSSANGCCEYYDPVPGTGSCSFVLRQTVFEFHQGTVQWVCRVECGPCAARCQGKRVLAFGSSSILETRAIRRSCRRLWIDETILTAGADHPPNGSSPCQTGQHPTPGCGRCGSPSSGAVGLVGNGLIRRDSLPIRLTGHDHRMAALLCGLSGNLHFLMRAVPSITLTCSRAVT